MEYTEETTQINNPILSIIIPTAHEPENHFLNQTLKNVQKIDQVEIIYIDKYLAISRAERLNIGFRSAKGSMILFHHPRSLIDLGGIEYLRDHGHQTMWGAFTHKFDQNHFVYKFTSWYSNRIRGRLRHIFYLDHCVFFHRSLFLKDLPDIDIFEDTILSYQLRKIQKPILLPFFSETSSIRFVSNGIFKQSLMNQLLKLAFLFRLPPRLINKFYEKNLNLNNDPNDRFKNKSI